MFANQSIDQSTTTILFEVILYGDIKVEIERCGEICSD